MEQTQEMGQAGTRARFLTKRLREGFDGQLAELVSRRTGERQAHDEHQDKQQQPNDQDADANRKKESGQRE